VKIDIF